MKITGLESNDEVLKILGGRVKDYRVNAGITQEQLAEDTGLSLRTIVNIETGKDVKLGSIIYVLRALRLLGNLDILVPEQEIRPSDIARMGKKRERVKRSSKERYDMKWGEDE